MESSEWRDVNGQRARRDEGSKSKDLGQGDAWGAAESEKDGMRWQTEMGRVGELVNAGRAGEAVTMWRRGEIEREEENPWAQRTR